MANSYRRLNSPEPSRAAFEDFAASDGSTLTAKRGDSVMQFKLASWFHTYSSEIDKPRRAACRCGRLLCYAKHRRFRRLDGTRAVSADAGVAHVGTDLVRPAGSRWGARPDLGEALKKLRGVVRQMRRKTLTRHLSWWFLECEERRAAPLQAIYSPLSVMSPLVVI